jgi:hypothetical protein
MEGWREGGREGEVGDCWSSREEEGRANGEGRGGDEGGSIGRNANKNGNDRN